MLKYRFVKLKKFALGSVLISLLLTSCAADAAKLPDNNFEFIDNYDAGSDNGENTVTPEVMPASDYSEFDLDADISEDAVCIALKNGTADISSENAELRDGVLIINEAGEYVLSGDFEGQVIVNAGDDDNVQLIFNGFNIKYDMAPVYIVNAKNVSITLADGTKNTVTDSSNYSFDDDADEPDAAVFSKCDLTINGNGSLEVGGNYACGIRSKDDLTVVSGNIAVSAVKDGIKGRDSVVIRDGNIVVKSGEDGIQSNNDEDSEKGYIIIEGGNIDITAGDDGIRGETWLQVYDGNIIIRESYEGLEAAKVEIYGGILDITASDDGLNAASGSSSDGDKGGMFGGFDRGKTGGGDTSDMPDENKMKDMHDNSAMPEMPENGEIPEMPQNGEIPDMFGKAEMPDNDMTHGFGGGYDRNMPGSEEMPGNADDRGNKGSPGGMDKGMNFGGGMMNERAEDGVYIKIAGGNVRVKAGVDVIDSNGTFIQTGGTVITVGPSMTVYGSPDCVVDCNGSAVSEGGTFISMAHSVGSNTDSYNKLNGFVYSVAGNADFNTEMIITDTEGNELIRFTPEVSCSVILVTSDLFKEGCDYSVMFGETVFKYTCTDGVAAIR